MFIIRFIVGALICTAGYVTGMMIERKNTEHYAKLLDQSIKRNIEIYRDNEALRDMLYGHVEQDVKRYMERMNYESTNSCTEDIQETD